MEMVTLEWGGWILEADAEKTRRFYAGLGSVTENCGCRACRNFELAAGMLPAEARAFFEQLGIAPPKAAEVCLLDREALGDTAWYGGFYHLCGRLRPAEKAGRPDTLSFLPVADGYRIAFTPEVSLPEDGLPEPAVQMEIDFRMPWSLDGEADRGSGKEEEGR